MFRRCIGTLVGCVVLLSGMWAMASGSHWPRVGPSTRALVDANRVNRPNEFGETPLYSEARRGNPSTVDMLLKRGADFEKTDRWGWTPLHIASARGHQDVVEILLGRGANPWVEDVWGQTPYDLAREGRHFGVQRVLYRALHRTSRRRRRAPSS